MSFSLKQCPTEIQAITCNYRTARFNTWGERGKGNGEGPSLLLAAHSYLCLSVALKLHWKCNGRVSNQQLAIQHTELWKSAKNVTDHGILTSRRPCIPTRQTSALNGKPSTVFDNAKIS